MRLRNQINTAWWHRSCADILISNARNRTDAKIECIRVVHDFTWCSNRSKKPIWASFEKPK